MKSKALFGIGLALLAVVAFSATAPTTPHLIQLCPVAAPNLACPATATPVCGIPTKATDPIHVVNVGYVAYNAISNSASVHDCTTSAWTPFSTTGIPLFSQLTPPVSPITTVTKTFNWVAPTQNTDGTAITGALTYKLYLNGVVYSTAPITGTSFSTALAPGAYSVTVTAVNTGGIESAQSSPPLAFTVAAPASKPNAPSGVTSN